MKCLDSLKPEILYLLTRDLIFYRDTEINVPWFVVEMHRLRFFGVKSEISRWRWTDVTGISDEFTRLLRVCIARRYTVAERREKVRRLQSKETHVTRVQSAGRVHRGTETAVAAWNRSGGKMRRAKARLRSLTREFNGRDEKTNEKEEREARSPARSRESVGALSRFTYTWHG